MTARTERALSISRVIAGLDEAGIRSIIDAAEQVGVGIGGTTRKATIGGVTVFVKQLPLTSSEEADPISTVNRIHLPFVSHYGIGSPSHGVGMELAAHRVTSTWVQQGATDFFPLLLGWRVIDRKCDTDLSEFEGDVPQRQWGSHWPQIQTKLAAMKNASKSVVLFLEYVPETLGSWVRSSLAAGTGETDFINIVAQIIEATDWMKAQGFQHFDVHPGNILVDEGRLLFTDFGLALYRGFELTAEEELSMLSHEDYDRDTALMHLFHWVLFELGYTSAPQRLALLRAAAVDPLTPALEPVRAALGDGADLMVRHAGVVVYITEMFGALLQDASATQYVATPDRDPRL